MNKIGIYYAYWTHEWDADFHPFIDKVAQLGFDILEINAGTIVPHWGVHIVAVAILFWFVSGVCGFPWWQYCLLIAYPGLSLGLLRAFTEHRAAADSQERTASVESNVLFGLMYLHNNLHVAHHLKPAMPWYEIPRFYRQNRDTLLAANGNFVYPGYAVLARRYFLTPVFSPVHPTL